MTNRIDQRFSELRDEGSAALVTFVTAGDPFPTIEGTANLIVALAAGWADVIEIGIPYSDPQADGPSVQAASQRALEAGVNTHFVFEAVKLARKATETPIIVMTYYNPVYKYGVAKFADDAAQAGVDGVILTDLPPEESDLWLPEAERAGLATIFLLAPTSTKQRIELVAEKMKSGFIYCVSRTGVTGARKDVPAELSETLAEIKKATELPVCVGFGISTPDHVATVSAIADGAVIGSALVDFLHHEAKSETVLSDMRAMIRGWKSAAKRSAKT